jgi:hypothetical protein
MNKRGRPKPNGANDLLLGATALQGFINAELAVSPLSRSQIYHLIETGRLPAGKLGGLIIGSKAKIRGHFAELAAGAVGPEPRPAAATAPVTRLTRPRRAGRGRARR